MEKNIRLLMFVNYERSDESIGVTKKIRGLINAFRKKGIEVFYTSYEKNGIGIFNNQDEMIYTRDYMTNKFRGVFRRFELIKTTQYFLKSTNLGFDILFTRWIGFDIPFINALKIAKKKKGTYVIIDMHSYFEGITFPSLKGKYMTFNTKMFKNRAAKYIDTFLTEGDVNILFGRKTIKAAIGVEIDNLPIHNYSGKKDELNIITVANERPYHGYDRLIKSLSFYKGSANVCLHIVGNVYPKTREMVQNLNLQDKVIFYGKQYGKQLEDIYNKCNLAAGPICQHRVGGKKDTGLKTKEYIGIGLPYFYGGQDLMDDSIGKYILNIPDDESMIDYDVLYNFYLSYCNEENVAILMREYAKNYFSWDSISSSFLEDYYKKNK